MNWQNNLYMTEETCSEYIYLLDTKAVACNKCIEGNFLFPLFFLVSFIPFTIIFSSWVVARFIYLPHIKQVKNEKDIEWPQDETEKIPYEKKYKLENAEKKNENLDTEKCSVCESTPDGLIFMKYNKKNEGFDWWSDNRQTAYKYLETVARKYVLIFKCSNLYIDREEDIKKQLSKEKEEREKMDMAKEDKKNEEDSDDDLFVKFKTNEKIKPKKGDRAAINGNKFKYCGKISDFKLLNVPEKKVSVKKKMDFSSWKTMFNSTI